MLELSIKIILFLTIICCITNIAGRGVQNNRKASANVLAINKLKHYSKYVHSYDTVFIGSSRVYRQISPALFDEANGNSTHSFNFGIPGDSANNSINLLRQILSNNQHLPNTIFVEFRIPSQIDANNENLNLKNPIDSCRNYFHKITKAGMGVDIVTSLFPNAEIPANQKQKLGKNSDGFYPLNSALLDEPGNSALHLRYKNFIDNPREAINLKNTSYRAWKEGMTNKSYDSASYHLLMNLIKEADQKGVKLIFIVLPLLGDYYVTLLPLANMLPSSNIIYLANPVEYPEFYDSRFMFDLGHLNERGANLFTYKVYSKYKQLPSIHSAASK